MTAHTLTVQPWEKVYVRLVCGCGGWDAVCAPGPGEAAGRLHHLGHVNEVIADVMHAEAVAELDAVLRPGETWVYLPYGRVRHIIDGPISQGYTRSNCNRSPDLFSAWLGTGSAKEEKKLVKLPPCPSCTRGRS